MKDPRSFFVSLSGADLLTLASLLLSCLGLSFAFQGSLTLAIALMLLSMLVDMFDGLVARRLHLESDFGKYLDSFCDVFAYLVLPAAVLFQMGMRDWLSGIALFAFLAAGVLRLSYFNIHGTVEERGTQHHIGLQVIWSHLLVVLAFPAWHWFGNAARIPLSLVLLAMAVFMIRNVLLPKPTRYTLQAILILSVAGAYFSLHLAGIRVP